MSATRQAERSTLNRWEYLPAFAQEQLPRYTSYPPANRFTPEAGPAAARAALAALPANAELSLYLHIPFCKKLCWYCGCNTSVPTLADPIDLYVDAINLEIERVAALVPPSARVTRVHFGGGSPDILSPNQIASIFDTLHRAFVWARYPDIAVECDPRGLEPGVIDAYAKAGLTRASLGVQVLDPGVQQRINRIQPRDQVEDAIRRLRAAGVDAINLDMMYGLPGQTQAHVVETATFAAMQDVDRVAVFGYAHVPWMKKHQKGIDTAELPTGEVRFRQAEAAAATLEHAGYIPVGFDHFAAPGDPLAAAAMEGRLHRNFQGYTEDNATALIGLGASAISSLPGLIYQNVADTTQYRAALAKDESAVVRGVALTAEDLGVARLIERLLCDLEVDLPRDGKIATSERLAALIGAGIAEMHSRRLTVTARGRPYARNVAACFDPEFAPEAGRHSLAV